MSEMQEHANRGIDRRSALRTLAVTGLAATGLSVSGGGLFERQRFGSDAEPGESQSPIALEHNSSFRDRLTTEIDLSYDRPLAAVERGDHGVKLIPSPGNYLMLNGKPYELQQIHFHTPSEHTIDGKLADGEMHFVHESRDEEIAVIGVLLQEGKVGACFEPIFEALPYNAGEVFPCTSRCNPSSLLPDNRRAFVYEGSLTTPPYTEGVHWLVMESPVPMQGPISDEHTQLGCLSRILGDNHRELQPDNDREVKLKSLQEVD